MNRLPIPHSIIDPTVSDLKPLRDGGNLNLKDGLAGTERIADVESTPRDRDIADAGHGHRCLCFCCPHALETPICLMN